MGTAFTVVIVVFLVLALLIAWAESVGGPMGDFSMVPGCLGVMVLVLIAIFTGNLG